MARNPALDAVRALAITLVVMLHAVPAAPWVPATVGSAVSFGARGVDLFFVLSGYLVGGIALRELAPRPTWPRFARFVRRRAYRTLPAYYVVFALYLGTLAFPRDAGTPALWPYLMFLQSYVSGPPSLFAGSWSLCIEEHFYLALPLGLALLAAVGVRRPGRVALALALFGVALVAVRALTPEVDEKVTHWRTDGLILGVVLAGLEVATPRRFAFVSRHPVVSTCAAAGLVALAVVVELTWERWWQPAFALAGGAVVVLGAGGAPWLARVGAWPSVRFVAKLSYAVYLVHPLVFRALEKAWFGARMSAVATGVTYVLLGLVGTLLVALALHRWVEAPMLARRDRAARA